MKRRINEADKPVFHLYGKMKSALLNFKQKVIIIIKIINTFEAVV